MTTHGATISWSHKAGDFVKGTYGRAHKWEFDGGAVCLASASPLVVPPPQSDPAGIDPEEALVAAISSCHMLWFLDVARRAGFVPASYRDSAIGQMEQNENGKLWLSRVRLLPEISWIGKIPGPEELGALHHEAHKNCYIANSVRTRIEIGPAKE